MGVMALGATADDSAGGYRDYRGYRVGNRDYSGYRAGNKRSLCRWG